MAKPEPAPVEQVFRVEYSDGTVVEFTLKQWAETIARALVYRCPECPRFTAPRK